MNLTPWKRQEAERSLQPAMSIDSWAELLSQFSFNGVQYAVPNQPQEQIAGNYASLAAQAYMSDSVVFACMATRLTLFTEARIRFRQVRTSGPGNIFGTPDLAPLETPWPGAHTGDLLAKAITYADLGGNFFAVRRGPYIRPLRPDWVTLILGSQESDVDAAAWDVDAEVLGYLYHPGGKSSGRDPVAFTAREVCHWAPYPDPLAQFRGMSWLTPLIREVMADKAATDHKLKFFDNGATPQMVIKLDTADVSKYQQYIELFKAEHEGVRNAYRTLFLAQGADVTPVGVDLKQLEFKVTQGGGETRIAAAARTPPIIVGLSEGLQSATYSNYGQARRAMGDGTLRPLWRGFCGAMSNIVPPPPNAELWYDASDIAFLREDESDAAEILQTKASTIVALINGGYKADAVVDAVTAGDLSRLEGQHTGLVSVQLQPPGTTQDESASPDGSTEPATNGNNAARAAELVAALKE